MRETMNAIAVLTLCVSAVVAAVVWFDDQPTRGTWICRVSLSLVALASVVIILKINYWVKPDIAPDFLGRECGRYLERGGLCFSVFSRCEDGVCFIHAMFQNRYDRHCTARIALRPVVGVFRSAKRLFSDRFSTIILDIDCGPGEVGVASLPLPLSRRDRGKKLTLQIGASVDYPHGKGTLLRMRDGTPVRYDAEFRCGFYKALRILYLVCGGILFTFPATVTFQLPKEITESVPSHSHQRTRILWTLGDDVPTTLGPSEN